MLTNRVNGLLENYSISQRHGIKTSHGNYVVSANEIFGHKSTEIFSGLKERGFAYVTDIKGWDETVRKLMLTHADILANDDSRISSLDKTQYKLKTTSISSSSKKVTALTKVHVLIANLNKFANLPGFAGDEFEKSSQIVRNLQVALGNSLIKYFLPPSYSENLEYYRKLLIGDEFEYPSETEQMIRMRVVRYIPKPNLGLDSRDEIYKRHVDGSLFGLISRPNFGFTKIYRGSNEYYLFDDDEIPRDNSVAIIAGTHLPKVAKIFGVNMNIEPTEHNACGINRSRDIVAVFLKAFGYV